MTCDQRRSVFFRPTETFSDGLFVRPNRKDLSCARFRESHIVIAYYVDDDLMFHVRGNLLVHNYG